MNALCYKIVFSKRLGALVAVGEHTAGQGKAAGTGVRTAVYPSSAVGATAGEFVGSLKAVFASVALTCFTATTIAAGPAANTLPTGYNVNSGNVAVSTSGADMTIKQTTDKASVNWQSFSIGSAASVNIQQNSASSVLLNRVVGNDPSQIFGKLTANGQVILINPNGVVFGKGGSVTASAFTASTFGMTEEDFNKGKRKFSRNGSTASVTVEEGASINTTTPGGYIALIAATVNNQGRISAKQGSVVLAAAETVTLPTALTENVGIPLSSKVRLELAPSTINASVENGGTITTDGGQVLMQAAAVADAVASITQTGTIDTTGEQGGAVTLQADHGIIKATGTIKANSTAAPKGGDIIIGRDQVTGILAKATNVSSAKLESNGGFVETSGDWLATTGTRVKAKDWLLDPFNVTIKNSTTTNATPTTDNDTETYSATNSGSVVWTKDITDNLEDGTSVKISTGTTGNEAGNITLQDSITVGTIAQGKTAKLTLEAHNGITFNGNAKIAKSQTNGAYTAGLLDVELKANGGLDSSTSSAGIFLNGGSGIDANGTVKIDSTTRYTGGWEYTRSALAMATGSGITGGDVEIKLTVDLASENRVFGLFAQNGITIKATTGDVKIDSTLGEKAINAKSVLLGSNYGNAIDFSAARDINITSTVLRTNPINKNEGVALLDTKVKAGQDFIVKSTVSNSTSTAISTGSNSGQLFQADVKGDFKLLSNQGSISLGNLSENKPITAKNITIDNTGISMGTDGKGQYTGSGHGITFLGNNGQVGLAATNQLTLIGAADTGAGVSTGSTKITAGSMSITGSSNTSNGVYANNAGSLQATNDIIVIGTSKSSSALSLAGAITSNSGAITLQGTNTDSGNTTPAVYINNSINAKTAINVSADTPTTPTIAALQLDSAAKLLTTNTGSKINIAANSISAANASSINAGSTGNGTVTLKAFSNDRLININNTNVASSNTELSITQNLINKITAGKLIIGSTDAESVKVSSAITTASDLELRTKASININAALTAGTLGEKNLTLNAGDQISQNDNGKITANKLYLEGSNATVALATAVNQVNQITANVKSIDFKNGKALQIGDGSKGITASGKVKIETTTGDLTLDQAVTTTAQNDADAVILIADSAENAGASDGGNIIKQPSGSVSVGNGSTAKLYTGSIDGSTGMQELAAGLGSGHYRYNSDETATNYTKALSAGTYAIYREKVTVNTGNSSMTYGDSLPTFVTSGLKNGDTLTYQVPDRVSSTSGNIKAGSYSITSNATDYGYTLSNSSESTLTVNQRPLTVSYTADNKVFDGTTTATVKSSMANLVPTDQVTPTHTAANFSDADVANSKTVTVTGIQLNSNNANNDAANYKVVTNTSPSTGTTNATPNATTATTTANITAVPPKPPVPVVPTDGNSRVKVPVGSANPFALASAEDLADDTCSANSIENCHCEASPLNANVDICYEPKAGAKGSAR